MSFYDDTAKISGRKQRDIFNAILNGNKKVETRAAGRKFNKLNVGDKVLLVCGKEKAEVEVRAVNHYKNIDEMLRDYKVSDIHPDLKSKSDLINLYKSWSGNYEKITANGIIAMEFNV